MKSNFSGGKEKNWQPVLPALEQERYSQALSFDQVIERSPG
jgi:hypothetical protein